MTDIFIFYLYKYLENFINSNSLNLSAINCIPIGIPFECFPSGYEIAGFPDKFACTVKMSSKYILMGSLFFFPNLNAV